MNRPRAKTPRTAVVGIGLLALAVIAGCGVNSDSGTTTISPSAATSEQAVSLGQFYQQPLTWRGCGDGFQCTKVKVPLDYSAPTGRSIEISVNRLRAKNQSNRIGALFVNPGGPGGSGLDYARAAEGVLSPAVIGRYDVIGFDPRGVGQSSPIDCLNDKQTDEFVSVEGTPVTAEQAKEVVDVSKLMGQTCEQNSPQLTRFIGTIAAAKDIDIIRGAIGEPSLNLLGKSYGTFLGLTYAKLFPQKVNRFVLDGVIDPTLTNDELAQGQADGFQLALGRFIANCAKHKDCPLPAGQAAGLNKINSWLEELGRKPIPAQPGRPLTRALAVNGIIGSMYEQRDGWPALRFALESGFSGDGEPMLQIVDSFLGRTDKGKYLDNSVDALYAVNCLDRPDRASAAQTAVLAKDWTKSAPTFGGDLAWGNLPCHDWPAPATDVPGAITAVGAQPILLVGTTNDPATPYKWAVAVSGQVENNSLITWNGDGHTAYHRGSLCVDSHIDAYLLAGTMPPKQTTC